MRPRRSCDAFGVGDGVDLDDPALDDGEAHHGEWPSTDGDHCSGGSVHQGRPDQCAGIARAWRATAAAPGSPRGAGPPAAEVGPQHDIGIEERDEGVEVAPTRRSEEGVDDLALAGEVGVRSRGSRRP